MIIKKLKEIALRRIVFYLTEILKIENYWNKEVVLYGIVMKETYGYKLDELNVKFVELKIEILKSLFNVGK